LSHRILAISGSPSAKSSGTRLIEHVLTHVPQERFDCDTLRLAELDANALIRADTAEPSISAAVRAVAAAEGLIVVTPIYKAAYSGLLKCFLDLLPQFGLAGKAVMPLATGGSVAHLLSLDYGLRPVLQSMGVRHVVQSVLVTAPQMRVDGETLRLDAQGEEMLAAGLEHFLATVEGKGYRSIFGHPMPFSRATG